MVKDIIVSLDGAPADVVKLDHAAQLAARFDAHITGMFINVLPDYSYPVEAYPVPEDVVAAMQRDAREQGDKALQALQPRIAALGVPSELRRFDILAGGVWSAAASQARTADLVIASRPYQSGRATCWSELVEAVLFDSGRAVYVVPDAPPRALDTVLVGWNDTRESSRAVAEAMPFLRKARNVVVAMIEGSRPAEEDRLEPGADIARHLARHGVKVELRHIPEWDRASGSLLNECERLAADLVVLGGYGHSRFREWVLGGITREFLEKSPVPVLMAH